MADAAMMTGLDLLMNPKKRTSVSTPSEDGGASHTDTDISSFDAARTAPPQRSPALATPAQQPNRPFKAPVMRDDDDDDEDADDDDEDVDDDSESAPSSAPPTLPRAQPAFEAMTQEDVANMKRELMYQFDRLEKKGVKVPKHFSLNSSLDEMRAELQRLKRDRELDVSVRFQRRILTTMVTGIEMLNNRFDPFDVKLDGWSENVTESISDYDEVFEELHEKYKGRAKMPPEVKLLFMLGGSAVMFHMTNAMFKSSSLPGLDQVLRQNPDLMRQVANATLHSMSAPPAPSAPQASGGIAGMFASMMGAASSAPPQQPPPPQSRPVMKGPGDIDQILRDLQAKKHTGAGAGDRVDIVSTVTESEISDVHDDGVSIGVGSVRKRQPRRTLTLD